MQRAQILRASRVVHLSRRWASSEGSKGRAEGVQGSTTGQQRKQEGLPDVEIGGVTFSNVDVVRKSEQYQAELKQKKGGQGGQRKGKALATDDAVSSLLKEGPAPATTSDEVTFAVPTRKRTVRRPKKAPEQVEGPPAPVKRASGPARAKRTTPSPSSSSSSSSFASQKTYTPEIPAPSTLRDQGRYLNHNSSLVTSLRHCAPPLQTVIKSSEASAKKKIALDSASSAAVLAQNGGLNQVQKSVILEQLSQLCARA